MHQGGQCFSSYMESLCTPMTSTTPPPHTAGTREVRRHRQTHKHTYRCPADLFASVRMSTRFVALCHLNMPSAVSSCLGRCTNWVGHIIFTEEQLNLSQVFCLVLLLWSRQSSCFCFFLGCV